MRDRIYKAYLENRKLFYLFYFIYAEVITVFTVGIFYSNFVNTFTFMGTSYIIKSTDICIVISDALYFIGLLLLLFPPIGMIVRLIKDKTVERKAGKIFFLFSCGVIAGFVAVFLVVSEWSLMGFCADKLMDVLDSCLHFYEKVNHK